MNISITNVPYFCLLWIGVGFIILMIGVFKLAHHMEKGSSYTAQFEGGNGDTQHIEELFSFFLEEEEKKNKVLRESLLEGKENKTEKVEEVPKVLPKAIPKATPKALLTPTTEEENFKKVIQLYNQKQNPEEIARQLKIGVGEVKLILSLYSMR